jgi:hypothetical protein
VRAVAARASRSAPKRPPGVVLVSFCNTCGQVGVAAKPSQIRNANCPECHDDDADVRLVPYRLVDGDVCLACGCTEFEPCPEGCGWANRDHTLCTACARPKKRAPAAAKMRAKRGRGSR